MTNWKSIAVLSTCLCGLALIACETTKEAAQPTATTEAPKTAAPSTVEPKPAAKPKAAGNFTVSVEKAAVKVGEAGNLAVVVKPKAGFKINKEFPWKAMVKAPEGVEATADALGTDKWKLDEKQATLEVPVKVSKAGEASVPAKLTFSVCSDERCDVIRDHDITWKVAAN